MRVCGSVYPPLLWRAGFIDIIRLLLTSALRLAEGGLREYHSYDHLIKPIQPATTRDRRPRGFSLSGERGRDGRVRRERGRPEIEIGSRDRTRERAAIAVPSLAHICAATAQLRSSAVPD